MVEGPEKIPLAHSSAPVTAGELVPSGTGYVYVVIVLAGTQLLSYPFFAFLQHGAVDSGDMKHPRQDLLFALGAIAPAVVLFFISALRCWPRSKQITKRRAGTLTLVVLAVSSVIIGSVIWAWVSEDLINYNQPW
jgi:hypothetical protein